MTSAIDLEWEEFSKPEGKSKHIADLVDTCVDVATKSSAHPFEDSVLPSIAQGMQNLLAIAAATEISFKEAEPIKALLANISKEEKTNAKAKIHICRTEKASKEAEEMNKLVTSSDKLDTIAPPEFLHMNLGSSTVKTSQALEIAKSSSQLKWLHPASTSRLLASDHVSCQDPSCFQSRVALKTRPPTCAKMDTTAGQVGATIPALPVSSLLPHGIKAQPTAIPPHLELSLASRLMSASPIFPRRCSDGSTTPGLAGPRNGS